MENKPHSQTLAQGRLQEFLIGFFITLGVLLATLSFLPVFSTEAQTILRSVGLSLAPAGVITATLSRYASSITELLLRETVEKTIQDRLQQDMKRLDSTVESGLTNIAMTVEQGVSQIERDMQGLSPLFSAASKLGLENVHLTRGIALSTFAWFLDAEVSKAEKGRVWIVSSSLKGFLEIATEHFDGRRMMERIVRSGCDFRIMMTDPRIANLRAKQERRADGEIPKEVEMNVAYLKRIGVKRESVKYYSGTPTVFAIATTDRILLNPYPYRTEAFRCFSIIVHKTLNPDGDIYHQYINYHFEEPWQITIEISTAHWEKL
jgi:hypothetical protein